ncbi:MAG TPA: TetR/AcrR family transcriptional regulator [Gammaproteobacteria bacterium]|nr:TetR/AcrR family transcriptional regulator [Gammaproteobacteria bacterium]
MNSTMQTQQRILNAARELIHSRSYADVGVALICDRAQVKKGSFYHFYPSKQELTLAVLDTYFVDMKEQLLDNAFKNDIPPLARLKRMAQMAYEFQKELQKQTGHVLGCPFGNIATELSTQDETIRKKVEHIFTKLQSGIKQVLVQAQEDECIEPFNTEATAEAMLAYFEGIVLLAKTRNDPEIIKQLLPAIADIRII